MQKLVEIFDTKYFPYHYQLDLMYFFDLALKCVNNPSIEVVSDVQGIHKAIKDFREHGVIEIDLADAHFVPDTMRVVMDNVSRGIIIFDSKNVYRDDIINENRRRQRLDYDTVQLPVIKSITDLPNYISELSTDHVYTIPAINRLYIGLVTLVTIFRPEIQFDLDTYYEKVFNYVANNIILEENIWDEYNYIIGQTFYTQKFKDNQIYVLSEGYIDYDTFRRNYTMLPSCFGKECLSTNKHWQLVQRVAVEDIKEFLSHTQVTITDIYPRR